MSEVTHGDLIQLIPASGVDSLAGPQVIITPSSGKKLRIYYASYNPSAAVEAWFSFLTGVAWLRNKLTQAGAVIAKDFGDRRYVQGLTDEMLVLTLSDAVPTIWNVFYVEVK